ncbi:MAG: hypothetical protein B7Y16_04020 [Methylotenera sp. 24-45-7]|nr:MAG: hypothetical protein B7Y16_04020 [Methylotenera sp. 24-45-7]OZA08294.1 MAG: hypothetical protein B7X97_06810 [Methylotenera sp. 17-45-7]OZA74995.1 MAG: hypothetical protein B7X71_12350 [Polynucleobacter sp. 39-46-10]
MKVIGLPNYFISIIASAGSALTLFGLFILIEFALPASLASRLQKYFRALTFILIGIAVMMLHVDVGQGTIIDERGAVIAVATIFSGPWVGGMVALVEALYRLFIGGELAWVGVKGIALDYALVLLVVSYFKRINKSEIISFQLIFFAGIAAGLGEAMSFIFTQPLHEGLNKIMLYGPSLFLAQLIATLLFGGLLKTQYERSQAMSTIEQKSLAISELLRQTVAALSSAMLHRDPTTANHQKNVAKLSVAIGKMLGLDAQRLEGLQLAALVHDIGQIQIPAEILSRARKLSNEEFELIKMHAEAGYAILYDIPFPWPIAEIVYQHHENLDGSGYPRQLAHEQILLEAKIIRVADSVEAMLSHRPFRRAYDKEFAFSELYKFSGKYYDPDVLDACIKLFNERNFSFSK